VPLFLASGATSLIYETLWARQLYLVFGTSQLAICTVLAAFMAGLALGGFAAARWAGRVARPLMAYALLEAFIGAYALLFPFMLKLVSPVHLAFWRALEPGPALYGAFQFLLLGTLLLAPTACMGATLPLLARFATGDRAEAGFQVGRLYGANTLGAVLGAGLAGFALLPLLGMALTTWWTAAANGLLALAAFALSRASDAVAPEADRAPVADADAEGDGLPTLLLVGGLAGFSGLLYEVAWFRLMALMLGGSAYAFSIMLLAFLLGIGIGGWVGGEAADRSYGLGGRARVLRGLAWLQVGVAALSWAAMYGYGELPFAFVWLFFELGHAGPWLWIVNLLLALGIMLPPALLMGASFPYLVRAAAGSPSALGRPVGLLYGVNTLGAIVGAAGGGLLILPALHVRGAVLAAASVNLVAALVAWGMALAAAGALQWRRLAAPCAAALGAIALTQWQKPPWNPVLMTSGMYKYATELEEPTRADLIAYAVSPFELLFYAEGLSSVVTVAVDPDDGNIWLANNGKVDASSHEDLATQVLLAHLPFVFRPDAERALVIGLASGITAGSVTLHPTVARIDVAEIEPAVLRASREFDAYNHRPLDDPRVRVYLNDARNHLALTADGSYDLVTSEPSNPWLSGVSNLFTREFFELGRRKLRPGGVWAQWIHTYGMTPDDLRSLLATFADVYPHVRLFRIDAADLVVLGSEAPLSLQGAGIGEIFRRSAAVAEDLSAIDLRRAENILGLYQCGRAGILKLANGIELNTDDNMRIEYSAPLHLHESTEEANGRMLERVAELPLEAIEGTDGLLALARSYARYDRDLGRALAALRSARARSPGDPEVDLLYRAYEQEAIESSGRSE
jgi:spermidine synthase